MKPRIKDALYVVCMLFIAVLVYSLGAMNGYRNGYQKGNDRGKEYTCTVWVNAIHDTSMDQFTSGQKAPDQGLLDIYHLAQMACPDEAARAEK